MILGKISTNIGKEIIAWTRTSSKSLLATKPLKVNISELKYCPHHNSDIVKLSINNYHSNIKKLALNEKDSKMLENLLSEPSLDYSIELREMFNQTVNRADIDLNELRNLFTGKNFKKGFGCVKYKNLALNDSDKLYLLLSRLKSLHPKDVEIIKHCNDNAFIVFYEKNILGENILPDKYLKKLSKMLEKEKLYIDEIYSQKLNKQIIECYDKENKTIFTYDTKKGILEFFEENGIKTVRNINGNETIYKINPNDYEINEIIKEIVYLKDLNGKPIELIKYEKSNIDGIFNVVKKDLKTDIDIPLSKVIVDNTGKKTVKQNLISPSGTKTYINYQEMPNGSTQYKYKIVDKDDKVLLDNIYSRTIINDSEFIHKINDKNYQVKFFGSDTIKILNEETKNLEVVDLKKLLSNLTDKDKVEIVSMLKKIPANELLALNKAKLDKICISSKVTDSISTSSKLINTIPNEFVFLHEFGHIKDMPETVDALKECIKGKISNNADFLKIYDKERRAFISKFGEDDKRIDYFIQRGSGLGKEGETLAEINALLSTPKSEKLLGTRSYLLAENFPESIVLASKYLLA